MGVEGQGGGSTVPRQRREQGASGTSDLELVERMRGGDTGAYDELYRRHAAAVRRYARTCCRDSDTADDLTNEVFTATLQAVRGGAGPQASVRAYLLTSVRRVAADWARTARREQLVEDFAEFAVSAEAALAGDAVALEVGADVRAMREADASMAVRAFRSLPERWQTVLWHTTVEEASPRDVAPLLGLTPNAAAVLAHRAREGLRQAFLQQHVSRSLMAGGDCARYAPRLGAYARGGLRSRAERGLRKHLQECARCATAALEVRDLNTRIGAVLPVALIGWFAVDSGVRGAAALWLGVAGAGTGTGAAAAAGGAAGGAGGGAAAEGLGAPLKAGIASGVVATAVAAVVAFALMGSDPPDDRAATPRDPLPSAPSVPGPEPEPEPAPAEPEPEPPPSAPPPAEPAPSPSAPEPAPTEAAPEPEPEPEPTSPAPEPEPEPEPPLPEPPPPAWDFELSSLSYDVTGEDDAPAVRLAGSSPVWQRTGMEIGGKEYAHGISVGAESSVTVDLNRECVAYRAAVGIDDMSRRLGAAVFTVYGDGALLWRSEVISAGDEAVRLDVPLDGVGELRLAVEPSGRLGAVAMADWAESEIACA
ncbi:sigma-70 family RNA polymerase sigma factor [Streptomyces avicenniae]|uniref:sigma-70 family RNA polymerase sigma factor n=1 Tax=Streptomyces avicenniae TaxID=500153 RepID=UPI00069C218C|nr:sigma-70 family RNA polymerase sigma factor [Streptomyces avicenniae]